MAETNSGQTYVLTNDKERAVSDDLNVLQQMRAQVLSDVLRAIVQRSYAAFDQPGVSVPPTGAAATPMYGIVLDGLDMVVDNPGSVLINSGVLAVWNGNPANVRDSGFLIVISPGDLVLGDLPIAANGSGNPRCDVIECSVDTDGIVQDNRDIFDEPSNDFIPAMVNKYIIGRIKFRVRQGTPGVAPGYAAGWLPLGLALLQAGANTNQVDFYDVRPLYRAFVGDASDWNTEAALATAPVRRSDTIITSLGASTVAANRFGGTVDIEHNGAIFRGLVRRNAPLAAANLANFGNTTNYTGGDGLGIQCSAENCARGSSMAVANPDMLILAAWVPDLGSGRPLPRCVRYSQSTLAAPTQPNRRTPHGPNGILLVCTFSQETMQSNGILQPISLTATGILGVLGSAYGVTLATAPVNGTVVDSKESGPVGGTQLLAGISSVQNQIIQDEQLSNSGGISILTTSSSAVPITGAVTQFGALTNDELNLTIGPLDLQQIAGAFQAGAVIVKITEDFGGTNAVTTYTWLAYDLNKHNLTWPLVHTVSKSGQVKIELQAHCDGTNGMSVGSNGLDGWATLQQVRP